MVGEHASNGLPGTLALIGGGDYEQSEQAGTSAGGRAAGERTISPENGPVGLLGGLDAGLPQPSDGLPLDQKTILQIWPGFNWLPGYGIDTHQAERNRYGRLFLLGALRPDVTWIGLDERTALIVHPDGNAEVVGPANVLVARHSPSVQVRPPQPGQALEARCLQLDVLGHGSRATLDEFQQPCELAAACPRRAADHPPVASTAGADRWPGPRRHS